MTSDPSLDVVNHPTDALYIPSLRLSRRILRLLFPLNYLQFPVEALSGFPTTRIARCATT